MRGFDRIKFRDAAINRLGLFTNRELSNMLGVSLATVHRLLKHGTCSVDTMLFVCQFCKLNPMRFIKEEGAKC